MNEDDMPRTKMEVQHAEIDEARQTVRRQRMFLNRFIGMRGAEASGHTKAYLQGVHDGLCWGAREIESITQYDDYQDLYDVRYTPDEVSQYLEPIVSEANNENWGNVRVNAEHLVERLEDAAEDGEE